MEIDPGSVDWSEWSEQNVSKSKLALAYLDQSKIPGQRRFYWLRHGECEHNIPGSDALYKIEDSNLNGVGYRQATRCSKMLGILADSKSMKVDVIISSPLSRSLQTALAAQNVLGIDKKIVVCPLLCERLATACDRGTPKSQLQQKFPQLDFSALKSECWWPVEEEMTLWGGVPPNSHPASAPSEQQYISSYDLLQKRVHEFLSWLAARPEENMLIVSHGAFNCQLLGRRTANVEVFGTNWPPLSFAPEGEVVVSGQYRGPNRELIQE